MNVMHRVEAIAARAALALVRAVSPAAASNIGGAVARAIGPLLPVSRVADKNLSRAMPDLDAPARRRVIRGVWDNLGRTVAEIPHVGGLRRTEFGPGWEINPEGAELMRDLAKRRGPVLFFSGHLGNWELLPVVSASFGVELAIFYRAAKNVEVDGILNDLRANGGGGKMFAKGAAGARGALRHLAEGGALAMLVDQKMNDGIAVPFFGRPAMTAPALAALALRFRCPVIPAYTQRIGPARFRVIAEPPLALPDTGSRAEAISEVMEAVNARLEAWIRASPQSWLWLHRRWPNDL
jgi:KDO2-lipid IV(A) lauroyltransferase